MADRESYVDVEEVIVDGQGNRLGGSDDSSGGGGSGSGGSTDDVMEVDVDFNGHQIKNAVVHKLQDPPSNPKEGVIYYNTNDRTLYYFNGLEWVTGRTYQVENTAGESVNCYAIYDSKTGNTFKFRLLKGDQYLRLNKDANGIINLTFNTDKLNEVYRLDGLADKVDVMTTQLSEFKSVQLKKANGSARTNVYFYDFGTKTFEINALGFLLDFINYNAVEYITGFDKVQMAVDSGELVNATEMDAVNHYYGNPTKIVIAEETDVEKELKFLIKLGDVTKEKSISIFGLRGPRFYGRVNSANPTASQIQGLTKDTEYDFSALKSRSGLMIDGNESKLYWCYAYPAAWGNLTRIYNALGTYYTPATDTEGTSTFTKKSVSISGIEYNIYIYRDVNAMANSDLVFV
jgi:hypothetical protein